MSKTDSRIWFLNFAAEIMFLSGRKGLRWATLLAERGGFSLKEAGIEYSILTRGGRKGWRALLFGQGGERLSLVLLDDGAISARLSR